MSKKRTAAEFNGDDGTNETPDVLQSDAKRAKLVPSSDATLQDLPKELLEDILIKAVVMEVKGMKLAKSAWKEKAYLATSRLSCVCLQWSNILATSYFRNKVHEILEGTAQETFRLEILHQSPLQLFIVKVTTMRDEVFLLCTPKNQQPFINVHDRNNMAAVKDVIPLPGMQPTDMAACSVSSCVYLLNLGSHCYSVLRVKRDGDQFNISPWINDLSLSFYNLYLGINGRLIVLSQESKPNPSTASIYNANGSLQHKILLFQDIHNFKYIWNVNQRSNGNLVLATCDDGLETSVQEIDAIGRRIRRYSSKLIANCGTNVADADGRIWVSSMGEEVELLDSEFNLLDLTDTQMQDSFFFMPNGTHYNSERNEIACVCASLDPDNRTSTLTIFRIARK